MSISEQIIQKVGSMEEDRLIKLLEYIEFLEYQKNIDSDLGLQVAKKRSNAFDEGKTRPLSKKEFWQNLQKKIG